MVTQKCVIWDVDCVVRPHHERSRNLTVEQSLRAGGDYETTRQAELSIKRMDRDAKARLTSMLVEKRMQNISVPLVTGDDVERAKERLPLPVHERAERLLRFLVRESLSVGQISENFPSLPEAFLYESLAWSESNALEEVEYLAQYLKSQGWIATGKQIRSSVREKYDRGLHLWRVEVPGYRRIEELEINPDSSQCFVAMWFDDSMNEARYRGIIPAIESAGYNPVIIDQEEFLGKIDDKIIAEIRRSKFMVADFTHRKAEFLGGKCLEDEEGHRRLGARGGVYYEAGFAEGIGLDVIPTCRSDMIDDVHFDTRQLNHIVWDSPEDLRERLENRIRRVIGEGPNSSKQ